MLHHTITLGQMKESSTSRWHAMEITAALFVQIQICKLLRNEMNIWENCVNAGDASHQRLEQMSFQEYQPRPLEIIYLQ